MSAYARRYEGTRWQILYGTYDGVGRFALNEMQRGVQSYLPYVIDIQPAAGRSMGELENLILTGTATDNPAISELIEKKAIASPPGPQAYTIACVDSPWREGQRVIAVAGADPEGVLYGVEDFNSRVLGVKVAPDGFDQTRKEFDAIPEFSISERPLIDDRGIWTWGYVIYDYRRFIDNMARLKMNMLTIWNDSPPINCREIIDYAHSRGVRIVLGFHWGWGLDDLDPNSAADLRKLKESVVRNYSENYRHLGMDGIYFQTFTEHLDLELKGRTTASLACEWVNEIAAGLFSLDADLHIQFGLHATSIAERYTDLAPLDPRVIITWEDAGALPYSFNVRTEYPADQVGWAAGNGTLEATRDYSKKLVSFRENRHFAMVPKGWTSLRWDRDFEHHGSFILGERDPEFISRRLAERQPIWDRKNLLWATRYPAAARFYREILECKPERMTVTALVEDGLFEEAIQPSVAMFAQTVWDPTRSDDELLELAMSAYYRT